VDDQAKIPIGGENETEKSRTSSRIPRSSEKTIDNAATDLGLALLRDPR